MIIYSVSNARYYIMFISAQLPTCKCYEILLRIILYIASIYCSIFTYLETTEWIFNLSACYNQFPFIFTNTFLDIMHEITVEVDGETYRKVASINTSRLEACFRFNIARALVNLIYQVVG